MTEVVYLSTEALLRIASALGVRDVRDIGLLDSAAQRPQSSVFGSESYPSLAKKGAALIESIVRNHPLIDGNKRLGWSAVAIFFEMNDSPINISNDEAYEFTYAVAAGKLSFLEIAQQLEHWLGSSE